MQANQRRIRLSFDAARLAARRLADCSDLQSSFDPARNILRCSDAGGTEVCQLLLPLPLLLDPPDSKSLAQGFEKLPLAVPPYLLLLIQAGNAALAYCEEGEPVYSKVIRKYMVRKSQGKAQISYLKSKGKSRLGSRVRLAQSLLFFEEINALICDWWDIGPPQRILYSCPVRLWPHLFQSKLAPPFAQRDERLRKIPLDVHTPRLEELQRINRIIRGGALTVARGPLPPLIRHTLADLLPPSEID